MVSIYTTLCWIFSFHRQSIQLNKSSVLSNIYTRQETARRWNDQGAHIVDWPSYNRFKYIYMLYRPRDHVAFEYIFFDFYFQFTYSLI